jgi:hypothetical protein
MLYSFLLYVSLIILGVPTADTQPVSWGTFWFSQLLARCPLCLSLFFTHLYTGNPLVWVKMWLQKNGLIAHRATSFNHFNPSPRRKASCPFTNLPIFPQTWRRRLHLQGLLQNAEGWLPICCCIHSFKDLRYQQHQKTKNMALNNRSSYR